jgi:hypothetical protein
VCPVAFGTKPIYGSISDPNVIHEFIKQGNEYKGWLALITEAIESKYEIRAIYDSLTVDETKDLSWAPMPPLASFPQSI